MLDDPELLMSYARAEVIMVVSDINGDGTF